MKAKKRLVVTTTYEPVDAEWLYWYIARLKHAPNPESRHCADLLGRGERSVEWSSKDPSGPTMATTRYEVTNV